jgi:hypothetical protein
MAAEVPLTGTCSYVPRAGGDRVEFPFGASVPYVVGPEETEQVLYKAVREVLPADADPETLEIDTESVEAIEIDTESVEAVCP